MLTFEDCLGLCELSEEEIRAIAEHEHLPQIVALELGNYLMRGPDGELLVSHMFIDDIRAAERRGDRVHAALLKRALRQFIDQHGASHPPPASLEMKLVEAHAAGTDRRCRAARGARGRAGPVRPPGRRRPSPSSRRHQARRPSRRSTGRCTPGSAG